MWNIFFMKGRWEIKIKNAPVFNRNKTNLFIFNLPCVYETLATDSKGNCCIDLKAALASSDSLLEVVIEGQVIHIDCLWRGPQGAWPRLMSGCISLRGLLWFAVGTFLISGHTCSLSCPQDLDADHSFKVNAITSYISMPSHSWRLTSHATWIFHGLESNFLLANGSEAPKAVEPVEGTVRSDEVTRL